MRLLYYITVNFTKSLKLSFDTPRYTADLSLHFILIIVGIQVDESLYHSIRLILRNISSEWVFVKTRSLEITVKSTEAGSP